MLNVLEFELLDSIFATFSIQTYLTILLSSDIQVPT